MTALFVVPVYFGVGAVAHPFIELVFGEKWEPSAHLLSILALLAPTQVMAYYLPNLLISQGKPNQAFTLNMINLVVNLALPLMLVYWGLTAVVIGIVLSGYITLLMKFAVVKKHIGISLREAIANTWRFSLAGLVMYGAVLYSERTDLFGLSIIIAELAVLVAMGALIYSAILLVCFRKHTFTVLRELRVTPKMKPPEGKAKT